MTDYPTYGAAPSGSLMPPAAQPQQQAPQQTSLYDIETPSGHVVTIEAHDPETALAGANKWHEDNSGLWANIKGAAKSFPQGVVKGFQTLENVGLALGGAREQDTSPEFDPLGALLHRGEKKALEVLPPVSPNTGGRIGDAAGKMVGFNPAGVVMGPIGAVTSAFASAGGGEAGRQLAEGTPFEPYAELAGGVLGPYAASKGLEYGAKIGGQAIGGMLSHAGADVPKQAFEAGLDGGQKGQVFREYMRGKPPEGIVAQASDARDNLMRSKSADFEAGVNALNSAPQKVGFGGAIQGLNDAKQYSQARGFVTNEDAESLRQKLGGIVQKWVDGAKTDPSLMTQTGVHDLKKAIANAGYTPAVNADPTLKNVVDTVYHATQDSISKVSPEYKAMIAKYAEASNELGQLTNTFSLKPDKYGNVKVDTSLRKLLSTPRNDVNTNYGARVNLAKVLEDNGAPNLGAATAGAASSSFLPRGLGRIAAEGGLLGLAGQFVHPGAVAMAPLMSPRLTGEAAHFAGRAAGYFNVPQAFEKMQGGELMAKNLATLLAQKANQK